MSRIAILMSLMILSCARMALAGSSEDVAAATQAWIDAMNSRDPERVVALYDPEAVLWGTISPVLRDRPAAIQEYFDALRSYPPEFKVAVGEQRIRIFGDIAINTGSYSFSNVRDGKPTNRPARFSFVYRNRDGRWLIVDHHSSAAPAPPQ